MPEPAPADEKDSPQPECPLSMPGSPLNCIFSAALRPEGESGMMEPGSALASYVFPGNHYQLLLASSAFHPPKA